MKNSLPLSSIFFRTYLWDILSPEPNPSELRDRDKPIPFYRKLEIIKKITKATPQNRK